MSLSKYCREGNIDLAAISIKSGVYIKDLYIMYNDNIMEFERIVNKWSA